MEARLSILGREGLTIHHQYAGGHKQQWYTIWGPTSWQWAKLSHEFGLSNFIDQEKILD